ncbi:hypothetical protein [Isobaculum melis]|uniref:Uncharacterized protein n=1 Tax=Isobaculum melis TaxID=142588 RepID=A0A1H9RKL4_9LACT|nr:hypothetical protein [Isobaculum melis]SER73401.1 hypothetical protein SAMN04488559_104132 [Isobaculum melis]
MRQKEKTKWWKYGVLVLSILLMILVNQKNHRIEAQTNVQKNLIKKGPIEIDEGLAKFEVPSDANSQEELGMPTGYVQDKGYERVFYREQIHSYSSQTSDRFFASPYYLADGHVLFTIMHRNTGATPDIYYVSLFYAKPDGEIIDQISVATGGAPLSPSFNGATANTDHFATTPSDVMPLATNLYHVQYSGYANGNRQNLWRDLEFSIENNRIAVKNWHTIQYAPPVMKGTDLEQVHKLYGTQDIINHGITNRGQHNVTEVYQWDATKNTYNRLVNLSLAGLESEDSGTWSYDIGRIRMNDGYYGAIFTGLTSPGNYRYQIRLWDKNGNHPVIIDDSRDSPMRLSKASATGDAFYYTKTGPNEVSLHLVDLTESTPRSTKILSLPKGSTVQIEANGANEFVIYGSISEPSSFLNLTTPGIFFAILDDQYQMKEKEAGLVSMTGNFIIYSLDKIKDNHFFITGSGTTRDLATVPPKTGWQETANSKDIHVPNNAGFGSLYIGKNHFPWLHVGNPLIINIDQQRSAAEWESILLNDVKVSDTYDLSPQNLTGQKTQAMLDKRINRNPINPSLPIAWEALGLDKTTRGANEVKYFMTDFTNLTTAHSRWVNKVDDATEITSDNKLALAASNFSIHVDDLNRLTATEAKKLSDSIGWNLTNGNIFDSTENSTNTITVNEDELKKIKAAKAAYDALGSQPNAEEKAKLIKPYPLTFTMQTKDGTCERIATVFVTDDTTEIDQDIVIYGFDFNQSIKKVKTVQSSEIITASKASAWDFKMNWKKGDTQLPDSQLSVDLTYLGATDDVTGLNLVEQVGDYKIRLLYSGVTPTRVSQLPTAHVFGDEVTIHVRQVVLAQKDEIVVPAKGYYVFQNLNSVATPTIHSENNVQTQTLTDDSNQTFESISLKLAFDYWCYQVKPIVPEYYQYDGFVVTPKEPTSTNPHAAANKDGNATDPIPILDFADTDVYWLTIYLKPNDAQVIKPYSWDYQLNPLGEVKP